MATKGPNRFANFAQNDQEIIKGLSGLIMGLNEKHVATANELEMAKLAIDILAEGYGLQVQNINYVQSAFDHVHRTYLPSSRETHQEIVVIDRKRAKEALREGLQKEGKPLKPSKKG